jgi:hypothetical protein
MKLDMDKIAEALKSCSGIVGSLLAILQLKVSLLPINPVIAEDWWIPTSILALLAGFGTHRSAKSLGKHTLGWGCLVLAIALLLFLITLTTVQPLSPEAASVAAHWVYVLFFVSIGGAIGGFLT